jgi:hypothetical protein
MGLAPSMLQLVIVLSESALTAKAHTVELSQEVEEFFRISLGAASLDVQLGGICVVNIVRINLSKTRMGIDDNRQTKRKN